MVNPVMDEMPRKVAPQSSMGLPPPTARQDYKPWYVVALMVIFLAFIAFVLLITALRPTADNTQLIATVGGIAALAVPSLLALIKSTENGVAIRVYTEAVNGRMAAWIRAAEDKARMQGIETGRASLAEVAALAAVVDARLTRLETKIDASKQGLE